MFIGLQKLLDKLKRRKRGVLMTNTHVQFIENKIRRLT